MVHAGRLRRNGARGVGGNRLRSGVARGRAANGSRENLFTVVDNGLERPWFGRVWLNPPYCRELLSPFVGKLVSEYARGAVSQAILLTHNTTDTEWFHLAARAVCFPSGRIRFLFRPGWRSLCQIFTEVGLVVTAL
jgi:DNA N-6-adenine-methyltransferase (Dam)